MVILKKSFQSIFLWLAILGLMLVVMEPGLSGGFFFDDNPNIVRNDAIHIHELTASSLKASIAGPEAGPLGRPVSVLSFAVTHYFFGLDSFMFKAVNLVIHAVNGLLVFWFMKLLLQNLRGSQLSSGVSAWLAFWVSAVWLVHPINVLPVMLSVQRMTLLSGMFMLLALIAHLKGMAGFQGSGARWGWLAAGWLLFWPLSILSKEIGLLFPLYVLLIAFFSDAGSSSRQEVPGRVVGAAIAFLLVIGLAMLAYLGPSWLERAYAMRTFTMMERLLTEARVLWFYTAQIIVPDYTAFGIYHDDIPISTSLVRPWTTLLAVIGWAVVLYGIVRLRRGFPVVSFAAAWFLVAHSLESTFLPLEITHEYRNYLPSLGLLLGAGYLGATGLGRLRLDNPTASISLAAIIPVLVLAQFTWMRADQLGKPLVGSQIEAARHPQSASANYVAAQTMIQSGYGDIGDPIGGRNVGYYLQQAGKADPDFKSAHLASIVWSCASGRAIAREWLEELIRRLEMSPMGPGDRDLPVDILKPLIAMPTCLQRTEAVRLFVAGAVNPSGGPQLQARFLEAASDYELLVSHDPVSAQDYIARAAAIFPGDVGLRKKLKEYGQIVSAMRKKR